MTTLSVCMKTVDAGFFAWEIASLGILFTRWLLAHFVEFRPAELPERVAAEVRGDLSWMQRP
jgi:hypothetical protein